MLLRSLLLLVLILTVSCSSQTDNNDQEEQSMDHSSMDHSSMDHSSMDHSSMDHKIIETKLVDMKLDFTISKDSMSGVNIVISTNDFIFSPLNVNKKHIDGEGHAHLYIDGKKWGRIYGKHLHVGNISDGEHEFKITLNTNLHDEYSVDGNPIKSIKKFTY